MVLQGEEQRDADEFFSPPPSRTELTQGNTTIFMLERDIFDWYFML